MPQTTEQIPQHLKYSGRDLNKSYDTNKSSALCDRKTILIYHILFPKSYQFPLNKN